MSFHLPGVVHVAVDEPAVVEVDPLLQPRASAGTAEGGRVGGMVARTAKAADTSPVAEAAALPEVGFVRVRALGQV